LKRTLPRRTLLTSAFAAPFLQTHAATPPSQTLPLWPSTPPGGGGPSGPPRSTRTGSLTNIATPTLTLHLPNTPNGAAILIAAGGGYRHIEMGKEALPAAIWLTQQGITAFTLQYRLPEEGWSAGPRAPFQDAQRALQIIQTLSHQLGLTRIAALGFSAGAHLLGLTIAQPNWPTPTCQSAPTLATFLMIYPIITLMPPFQNTSTRKVLIGHHPSPEEAAAWSVQTHITPAFPPCFLVQAADDPISNPANSALMESACQHAHIPVERHLFPTGGHGFGMGRPGTQTTEWPTLAENWLRKTRLL